MTMAVARTELLIDPFAERERIPSDDFCTDDGGVAAQLRRLGCLATRAQFLRTHSRSAIEAAVRAGEVMRVNRGRFVVAEADVALALAHRYGGVLC